MYQDRHVVGGEPDIRLEPGDALLQGMGEADQRIFSYACRGCAPMRETHHLLRVLPTAPIPTPGSATPVLFGRGQPAKDLFVQRAIGTDDAAAVGGGLASEIGEDAAGLFNDDLQRGDVPE